MPDEVASESVTCRTGICRQQWWRLLIPTAGASSKGHHRQRRTLEQVLMPMDLCMMAPSSKGASCRMIATIGAFTSTRYGHRSSLLVLSKDPRTAVLHLLNVRHGRTVHNAVHCGCQQREGTWIVRTVERPRYTPDGPRKGRNTCLGIFTDRNRAAQCAAPPDLCVPASLQPPVSNPRLRLSCCSMPS